MHQVKMHLDQCAPKLKWVEKVLPLVHIVAPYLLNHYKIQFDLTCSQVFSETVRRIETNDIPADSV